MVIVSGSNAQELELYDHGTQTKSGLYRRMGTTEFAVARVTILRDIEWVSSDLLARMNPKWAVPGKHTVCIAPYVEDGRKWTTAMVASYVDDMVILVKHDGVSGEEPWFIVR
jgi:hypothetical protein